MGLKKLGERLKKVKDSLERAKARAHGMTVPELRAHLKKRKVERRAFKEELKEKERLERKKFEKWKIEQKYKQKRKQTKSGKSSDIMGALEMLGGTPSKKSESYDPFNIFGTSKWSGRKHKAKRRKKR